MSGLRPAGSIEDRVAGFAGLPKGEAAGALPKGLLVLGEPNGLLVPAAGGGEAAMNGRYEFDQ